MGRTTKLEFALVDVLAVIVDGVSITEEEEALGTSSLVVPDDKGVCNSDVEVVLILLAPSRVVRVALVATVLEAFSIAELVTKGYTPGAGISTGQRVHDLLTIFQYKSTSQRPKPAASRLLIHFAAALTSYRLFIKQAVVKDTPGRVTKLMGMFAVTSRCD